MKNKLVKIIGGDKLHLPKRPGEPEITYANINKISKELGWSPLVNFEDGVKKMMAEISNWKEAPLWDKDSIEEAIKSVPLNDGDLLLITGSLYLCAEVRNIN